MNNRCSQILNPFIYIIIIFLLFLNSIHTYAGNKIRLQIQGGTMLFIGAPRKVENTYPEQWRIGMGIIYQPGPLIELCGIGSYHHLKYKDPGDSENDPSFIVLSHEPNGSPRMYEASIAVRLFIPIKTETRCYLLGQSGYYWTTFPSITTKVLVKGMEQTSEINGYNDTKIFYAFGLGAYQQINDILGFSFELFTSIGKRTYIGFTGSIEIVM